MALEPGSRLGHYEIAEPLGKGGMGEVYRARDTKLNRDVALKILPEAFANDTERMGRFQREAQVLASLNHANIGAIYGLEDSTDTKALVLEIIEGPTLAERIVRGPIPVEESLQIALQIAEALEAAHEKGIIHRDLKPANVKITPEGTVKVLDFGLAKAMEEESQEYSDMTASPTLSLAATKAGVILGTAAYMSPEQARGKPVDRRSDIFAFGALLYEMLTGERAFAGEDLSMTLASIMKEEPDLEHLPSGVGVTILDLLKRCLRKNANNRVRDIGDVRIAIQEYLASPATDAGVAPQNATSQLWKRWLPWAVAALFAAVALLAVAWPEPPLGESPLHKFHVLEEGALEPMISPDGRSIAFVRDNVIWIRRLDQLEARKLEGTEGGAGHFWSPDSDFLGFVRQNQLWRISATEGGSQIICDLPGGPFRGASWGSDETIVLFKGGRVLRCEPGGGRNREIVLPAQQGDTFFINPVVLPDGKGILFAQEAKGKIELFDGDRRRVVLQREGAILSHPIYSRTGHVIFQRTGSNEGIWAVPFSLDALKVIGEEFRLSSEVAVPSTSGDGTLVYGPGATSTVRQLVWVSRTGEVLDKIGRPQNGMSALALSPDETRVAVAAEQKIWIHDIERGNKRVITFGEANDTFPFWSTDGDRVGYSRSNSIQIKRADGSGQEEKLAEGLYASFSSGGKHLVYFLESEATGSDLWYLHLEGDTTPQLFVQTPHDEDSCALSPDGNYLAYESNESGRDEIYLKRFPRAEGIWMLSVSGGADPVWSKDGKELYYWQGRDLMVVEVDTTGSKPQRSNPQRLFSANDDVLVDGLRNTDVSRDGRFLMIQNVRSQTVDGETVQPAIVVIQNWFAEFKGRK